MASKLIYAALRFFVCFVVFDVDFDADFAGDFRERDVVAELVFFAAVFLVRGFDFAFVADAGDAGSSAVGMGCGSRR